MSIFGVNHALNLADPHYTDHVRYQIHHDWVGGMLVPNLDVVLEIPPRELWEWHLIHLCANQRHPDRPWEALDPWLEVTKIGRTPHETADHSRVIGAWCTQFNDTALTYQVQVNERVQYWIAQPFDEDLNHPVTTNGQFWLRAPRGSWPPGYAAAVYLQLEVERNTAYADLQGLGIAQARVSFGKQIQEYTDYDGTFCFSRPFKALTRGGETDGSGEVRCIIPPGVDLLAFSASTFAKGTYTALGFDLIPS